MNQGILKNLSIPTNRIFLPGEAGFFLNKTQTIYLSSNVALGSHRSVKKNQNTELRMRHASETFVKPEIKRVYKAYLKL